MGRRRTAQPTAEAHLPQPDRQDPVSYTHLDVYKRQPVRIDVAGGWTDTPPYSLYSGGSVVNLAIELNGQPPLQVYVKPVSYTHLCTGKVY